MLHLKKIVFSISLACMLQQLPAEATSKIQIDINPRRFIIELSTNALQNSLVLAARMNISDFLGDEAKSLSEIAYSLDIDREFLKVILEILSDYGIYTEVEKEIFRNNDLSNYLKLDHPESLNHIGNDDNFWKIVFQKFSKRELVSMLYFPWVSQALHAVVNLKIPDLLKDGPMSVSEIAQITSTDENLLYRVLRMLKDLQFFIEILPKVFSLAITGDLLLSDHPESLTSNDLFFDEKFALAWTKTLDALKTGKTIFEIESGFESGYDYMKKDSTFVKKLNQYMADKTNQLSQAFVDLLDFSEVSTIADIGGGLGQLSKAVIEKYPNVTATVFDLPEMIAEAKQKDFETSQLKFVSGDVFKSIPKDNDVYILSALLHIFDDEKAIKILTNCKNAMPPHAKLLIVESFLSSTERLPLITMEDVKMGMVTGGVERTDEEYAELLEKAGFQVENCFHLNIGIGVLEATKL